MKNNRFTVCFFFKFADQDPIMIYSDNLRSFCMFDYIMNNNHNNINVYTNTGSRFFGDMVALKCICLITKYSCNWVRIHKNCSKT